ncbi:MAG: hypothetical protein TECD_00631 [Hyphomicrobiaceae bacterium hypho_1]
MIKARNLWFAINLFQLFGWTRNFGRRQYAPVQIIPIYNFEKSHTRQLNLACVEV